MTYTEVTVVWEGAVSDDMTFTDDQTQDMLRFIAIIKSEAETTEDLVAIYTLYHGHDLSLSDCECVQYLTDHRPYWANQEEN